MGQKETTRQNQAWRGWGESCHQLGPPTLEDFQRLSCAPLGAKASLRGRNSNLLYLPHAFIMTVPHDGGSAARLSPSSRRGVVLEGKSP